jgi:hypothetical protein
MWAAKFHSSCKTLLYADVMFSQEIVATHFSFRGKISPLNINISPNFYY